MTRKTSSARARGAPKNRPPPVLHVYDRRKIMARAWQIARERHIAIGPAQKIAWADAKGMTSFVMGVSRHGGENPGALVSLRHHGALAPLRRRLGRVLPLLITAARWIERRFIPSRVA